ncbi:MAG TPA: DUF2628 domain-containing protein [Cyclobacteriaceae bacterium]|nr:DUF2628 domain-containing protein [Cyclobacteriaceae bacterium]
MKIDFLNIFKPATYKKGIFFMIDDERYLIAYFGRQSDYYLEKYKAYHQGDRTTFNIGPFLAGVFWFLYRKLYKQLIIVMIAIIVLGFIEVLLYDLFDIGDDTQNVFDFLLTWVFGGILGFLGNRLYFEQADKKINRILSETSDEDERIRNLTRAGGVSWTPFVLLGLLIVAFLVLNNTDF